MSEQKTKADVAQLLLKTADSLSGLADSVIEHFKRMNAAPGAVRAEIHSVAIA